MADMIVSGAGWTAANGTYAEYGTLGGKPRYRMASAGSESGYIYIAWAWDMYMGVNNWGISTNSEDPFSCRYFSADDVATPDLVATWVFSPYGMQIPPLPTVTAEQSGTTHEGEVALSSLSYLRTKKA